MHLLANYMFKDKSDCLTKRKMTPQRVDKAIHLIQCDPNEQLQLNMSYLQLRIASTVDQNGCIWLTPFVTNWTTTLESLSNNSF